MREVLATKHFAAKHTVWRSWTSRFGPSKINKIKYHHEQLTVLSHRGSDRFIMGIDPNITKRKLAEEALRESERLFRDLFENSPDPEFVEDENGVVLDANLAACQLHNLKHEQLVSTNILELVPEDKREEEKREFRKWFTGELTHWEGWIQTCSGCVVPVVIGGRRIMYHGKPAVLLHVRDITERKRTEEALRRISVQLLQSQDEERRRIARELHDTTGQNLAILAMNLDIINKSGESLGAPARKALAESVALLDRCYHEIRTLSYLLHPPLMDERGLIRALDGFVEGFTQRSGIRVDLEVPPNLQRLAEDVEISLFRIVQESLTNVHRHSKSSSARIRLSTDQTNVQLEVQDDGGSSVAQLINGNPAVLGVGVSGVRERVKQLGGQMEIESDSQGTTIRVTVPIGGCSATKLRVLVAGNHEVVRTDLRSLLEGQLDCEVCAEAVTGSQAVALAQQLKPDIVVLDITMAELNGLEATRQILKEVPHVQVLILGAEESEHLVREILAAGAHGYVLKSDARRELVAALRCFRRRELFFTSKVARTALRTHPNKEHISDARPPHDEALTPRERKVLQLLAEGKNNKEVAGALGISLPTVETHRAHILRKLGLHSIADLVHYAVRNKIVAL
jgi:PAS domain S-box-containing protein